MQLCLVLFVGIIKSIQIYSEYSYQNIIVYTLSFRQKVLGKIWTQIRLLLLELSGEVLHYFQFYLVDNIAVVAFQHKL